MIHRQAVRRAAFAAMGVAALAIVGAAWRTVAARSAVAELRLFASERGSRLAEDRRTATTAPEGPKPAALDRSRAVSRLRSALGALTAAKGCAMDDFQASTEELPYLTSYAADSRDPGWMQVPVKAQLHGRSAALMAAVAGLRALDVPFEIETIEFARKSTDKMGMADVGVAIGMKVLVYRGEA